MRTHNERTGQPLTVGEIITQSIFFSEPMPYEQRKKQWEREAKLDLIGDILDMRIKGGEKPSGSDFDLLYDMEIDQLHLESIKTQDRIYYKKH